MSEIIDWNPLGDQHIRKSSLYNFMSWNPTVDLSQNITCVSKYGGLIATCRDESQSSRSISRPDIHIYNAAGKEISAFKWNSGVLIGLAWTHADQLLCIQEDGQVLLYNMFCHFIRSFTMGNECRENKVMEFEVFSSQQGTGLAVMSGLYRFFIVYNVEEPKARMLSDVPGLKSTPPSSWCVLPGPRTSKVLAANEADIYSLDTGGQCFQQTPTGLKLRYITELNATPASYISMSVSVNGKHLVLCTESGTLWIGSSDFQTKYCEFNTNIGSRPKQLLWCCNSISNSVEASKEIAVVAYWPKMILVVGKHKDWVRYQVDDDFSVSDGMASAVLCPDVDGVHIVTPTKHEFLQYVPKHVESIYKFGSMAPGALLHEANKKYENHSQKADEFLRMLIEKKQLEVAVERCILAASAEFSKNNQTSLLRAASFGKTFIQEPALTDLFVNTCQMLRVLNAVRDFEIGIGLTYAQLENLKMDYLIDRLVVRRQFHLAFHICKYLKIPEDQGSSRILSHWACYKVQQTEVKDTTIAQAIRSKLKSAHGVSYANIAEKAVECGRKDLAIKLLEFESRASEQVRLLSKLGKHTLALEKAVASGNTDLAYSAISKLRERTNLSDFLVSIRQQPIAYKLHLKYCREQNERMLKDLHEQEDNFVELAHCHIKDSFDTFRPEERVMSLHAAMDNFSKARDEFSVKATEEQMQLLRDQTLFEQDGGNECYVETSLHDTLHTLLSTQQLKRAEQMRKQYKVTDKRWWWLRITALGETQCWPELESFSKSKKSPIGYAPFIEVCMKNNATNQVTKYITKIPQEKRVETLLKVGNMQLAAEIAIQTKNLADMDNVLKKCGLEHRDIAEKVRNSMAQLQRR